MNNIGMRVVDPVKMMQWIVDNGYEPHSLGVFWNRKTDHFFTWESFIHCGRQPPEGWEFPELLEKVENNPTHWIPLPEAPK